MASSASSEQTYLCGHAVPKETFSSTLLAVSLPSRRLIYRPPPQPDRSDLLCPSCTSILRHSEGETPASLALTAEVMENIPPHVRQTLISKGIKYVNWDGRGVIQDPVLAAQVQKDIHRQETRTRALDKARARIVDGKYHSQGNQREAEVVREEYMGPIYREERVQGGGEVMQDVPEGLMIVRSSRLMRDEGGDDADDEREANGADDEETFNMAPEAFRRHHRSKRYRGEMGPGYFHPPPAEPER